MTNTDSNVPTVTPANAGCWIDGHWGQYGVALMVELAEDFGYNDTEILDIAHRHTASMGPSDSPLISDTEHEILLDATYEVEEWMTANVAPDGYSFGWYDGEFFLWSEADWSEAD